MKNVLLLGAGTMGSVHAGAFSMMDNVNLIGIVDQEMERAQLLAAEYNSRGFETFEDALEEIGDLVDVVDICLPTDLHKDCVIIAAEAGKHVICEKPLARTLEEAEEIIKTCKKEDVQLFVGHVVRFFPEYVKAKKLIDANKLGKVAVARMTRGGVFPTAWNDWYTDYNRSGGLILDMIIHDFDYLRWCFGEVERVFAKSLLGRNYLRLEYALVTLRFKSGVIAHIEGTWAHEGFSSKFEIAGEKGVLDFDSDKATSIKTIVRGDREGVVGVAVPESPFVQSPYYRELKHFMSCMDNNEEPIVTAEDAYKALEIADAALQSIQTGEPVSFYSE